MATNCLRERTLVDLKQLLGSLPNQVNSGFRDFLARESINKRILKSPYLPADAANLWNHPLLTVWRKLTTYKEDQLETGLQGATEVSA